MQVAAETMRWSIEVGHVLMFGVYLGLGLAIGVAIVAVPAAFLIAWSRDAAAVKKVKPSQTFISQED